MPQKSTTRRHFLQDTTRLLSGSWLATHGALVYAAAGQTQQAMAVHAPYSHLTPTEALTLAALSDQIFPPDVTPGASQLGAVYFIDAALGSFMASLLPVFQLGVVDLNERSGQNTAFYQLGFDRQTDLVKEIENTPFFGHVHFLTLCGLFALPSYGGNRDSEAWKMIGFEARHTWQHPFGYYDAQYAEETDHAAS